METSAWYENYIFLAVVSAWTAAQFIKFVTGIVRYKKADFYYFVSTGGMPSAHSASVSALAASVGLHEGFNGSLFAIALTFAFIVMFDAQSVRRAAGHQARIMNQMVDKLFKDHHWPHGKLKELLGHTRLEVLAGMSLGTIVAALLHHFVG